MWGTKKNKDNDLNYSYPHQSAGQPGSKKPKREVTNRSKIPLNPGVALLGLVGKATIDKNKDNWEKNRANESPLSPSPPNFNFNYPSMMSSIPKQPSKDQDIPSLPKPSWGSNMSKNQQSGSWGQNTGQNKIGYNFSNNFRGSMAFGSSGSTRNSSSRGNGQKGNNGGLGPNGGDFGGTNGQQSRDMSWNGYRVQQYMLNKMILDQYIPTIFQRWDLNKDGSIQIHEFPGMICELFKCMNMPPPSQNDIWYLMWRFDQNGDGEIDYFEWANMVYTLGGLKKN